MNWEELKKEVDKAVNESGIDKDSVEVYCIDVSYPIEGRVHIVVEMNPICMKPGIVITSHSQGNTND